MREINKFIRGFKRFKSDWLGPDADLFDSLKKGQSPGTMVIGCSDSWVDPLFLTDGFPGDLFVVRNVANLVPPCEPAAGRHGVSAALEYAVCHLEVENIVVMGHSQCSGIKGLMDGIRVCCGDHSFVGSWVDIAQKAKEKVLAELPNKSAEQQAGACEKVAILLSLENLMSFPWIREKVETGRLSLYGWYFDLQEGTLAGYSPCSGAFELIS